MFKWFGIFFKENFFELKKKKTLNFKQHNSKYKRVNWGRLKGLCQFLKNWTQNKLKNSLANQIKVQKL
jgi:hypothetical protein